MKKILLIKPDYNYFSIGLAYVAGALKKKGIPYDFIDAYLDPQPDFERILNKESYLAVASGGLIGSYTFFKTLFSKIKAIDPDMPCVLGGNITTAVDTGMLLSAIPVDYLVVGEGEITFPELLEHMDKGGDGFDSIDGIVYRHPEEKKGYVKTRRRKQLDLVSTNWMPDWSFFDLKRYGFQTMPVLTGRGCTGRCSFCSPTNGGFRGRPVEHIIEEINDLYSTYDFVHLVFMNEIFFPDEENIRAFCHEYKKIKPERHWHCLMRMDINPDVLFTMRDAGCILMNVGVESGSNRVLENIKKDITTDDTRRFIHAAKKADVVTQASFMMANFGETEEDIVKTVDLILELEISGPMALTINYPGTLNYHRARKRDRIPDEKAYVESLDFLYSKNYFQVISGHRSGTLNYLNLSDMNDETLFTVVEREMRRYHSRGFCARNVRVKENMAPAGNITLAGTCPFCGNPVEIEFHERYLNPFNLRVSCAKCGERDIYFSPFELESYKRYFDESLANPLKSAQRPVIISGFEEARIFLMLDLLCMDYTRIRGFIAHQGMPEGYALNYPIVPLENIDDLDPDLFVVISGIPYDIQLKLNEKIIDGKSVPTVWLSPERAFKDVILLNGISGKKNLLISSGPLDLLKLFLDSVNQTERPMSHDLLIQKSRYNQIKDHYDVFPYFIPESMITLAGFDPVLLEELKNKSYESVIFLANNNELMGYQEIRNLSEKLNPDQILAFPIGNMNKAVEKMHLFVL